MTTPRLVNDTCTWSGPLAFNQHRRKPGRLQGATVNLAYLAHDR
jgi:hypothetical protein